MKQLINPFLFFLALIWSLSLTAQNTSVYLNTVNTASNRLEGKLTGVNYHLTSLSNSKFFLQHDWVNGAIVLEDDDTFKELRIRYLAHDDELVVYNDNLRKLFIVDKKRVSRFEYVVSDEKKMFVKLYYTGLQEGERYFQQIYKGIHTVLAFHFINEVKTSPYTDAQGVMRDTEYRNGTNYFMHSENGEFVRLHLRRQTFFKIFPEKKKEIRKLFRKNNVDLFDEKGLVQSFKLIEDAGLY